MSPWLVLTPQDSTLPPSYNSPFRGERTEKYLHNWPAILAEASADPYAVERRLLLVLVQLCIIIAAARVVATMFRKLGQPAVVGEIVAGLILGPSALGKIEQAIWGLGRHPISSVVFSSEVDPVFGTMKELGLVFLMFLVGLEFDFSHLKTRSRAAVSISVAGLVLPFALGFGLAHLIAPYVGHVLKDGRTMPLNLTGFSLFMGTATCITALPVLGRMMVEWDVTRTRLGAITITAAAVNDATGWILLAAVSAAVRSGFDPWGTTWMVGAVLAFALVMIFVVRPLLGRWIGQAMTAGGGAMGLNGMAAVLVIVFLCAITTSIIGIFAIFGGFLLGAVLSDLHDFRDLITSQMRNFITVFFLPIFFTYTGLKTDIGALNSPTLWLIAGAVCAVAIIGKLGGCTLAARWGGFSWREAGIIGVLMNTRGLMELVVINVGWELGVIPRSVFCMLVLMAVVTTVMTTPGMRPLARGTEFEPFLEESGFLRKRQALAASEANG